MTNLLRFSGVETVTLTVGAEAKPFKIHKSLLCNASSFFTTAFKSKFKESSELEMSLPDDEEEIFVMFTQWLYAER